jgi:uncharacterized membrane protein
MRKRFWEIDVLRGIAVFGMILFHFSYDLAYFADLFDVGFFRSGLALNIARLGGGLFIFLAGLSLTLSYRRAVETRSSGWKLFRRYLARGVWIFSFGLAITFLTWIFLPQDMIVFGILHLIGASIILAYPFITLKLPNVVLALFCIAAGLYLRTFDADHPYLAWLGIKPDFFMLDYWPIFPWFGVMLLGIFAGNTFYGGDRRRTTPGPAPKLPGIRPLTFLGRHSLPIYLLHQPILIAALVLLGVANVETL